MKQQYQTAESVMNPITAEMIEEFYNSFEQENSNLTLIEKCNKLKKHSGEYNLEAVGYANYRNLLEEKTIREMLNLLSGFSSQDAVTVLMQTLKDIENKKNNLIL